MVEYRDVSLEDLSTLERIQRALDPGQIKEFHYHDHELALRHHWIAVASAEHATLQRVQPLGRQVSLRPVPDQ